MASEDTIWSFGYGSNMDVKALQAKKSVKVLGKWNINNFLQTNFQQFNFNRTLPGYFGKLQTHF